MKKIKLLTVCLSITFTILQVLAIAQTVTNIKPYTSVGNATWTIPAGTKSITIEAIGGGGAGGRARGLGFSFRQAGGGSGAAYAMSELTTDDFMPGQTITISVGAGGSDGTNGNASVVAIDGTVIVRAAGGVSVTGNNNETGATAQAASASIGDVIHIGGNGSKANSSLLYANAGGGGGAGGSTSNGGNAINATTGNNGGGVGGSGGGDLSGGYVSGSGASGTGTWSDIPRGHDGNKYGGGGSGAWSTGWGNHEGGQGAQGIVVITYVMTLEVDDVDTEICSSSSFEIIPTGIIPEGTLFSWEAPAVTGIIGAAAATNQTTISGTLTNITAEDVEVTYTVNASNGTFTDQFTVTVLVWAAPAPGMIEEDIISCTEGDTIKSFASVQDAAGTNGQYAWQKSIDGSTWTDIANAMNKEYTPTFLGNVGTTYYRRVYTTDCGIAYSNVLSMTYPGTIDPGDITSANTVVQYCPGTPVNATLESHATVQSGEIPSVQWQSSSDGVEWEDIETATDNTYAVMIEALTETVYYRYFVTLAGCTTPIYANNVWIYTPYVPAVINSIAAPNDLCPGQTSYMVTADITEGDAPIESYTWTGATGTSEEAVVVAMLPNCGETYEYTLQISDAHNCQSDVVSGTFTTKNPELGIGTMENVQAKLSGVCSFVVPTEDALTEAVNAVVTSDCQLAVTLDNITPAPNTDLEPATITMVSATATDMCGHVAEVQISVTSSSPIMSSNAISDFDDADVLITLWYGTCDTLYNVETPTFTNNVPEYEGMLVLTNDQALANEGPILGRLVPGKYVINWKITDPCGSYIVFPKSYIVVYPNCGDDDPNYEEPYTVSYDGYTYSTVRIGCECWLKENLHATTNAQGAGIAAANAYQNDLANVEPYGLLYSWYSAMGVAEDENHAEPAVELAKDGASYVQGVCPDGWAVPTAAQYDDMMTYADNDRQKASSPNVNYWLPGTAGVTPNNGFEAAGAGYYDATTDHFYNKLAETDFWDSSESLVSTDGNVCILSHICTYMMHRTKAKSMGCSVRCVKVEPAE